MANIIPDNSHYRSPDHPAQGGTGWLCALRSALALVLLCGGLYPGVTTLVGATIFPHQSTGSLIEVEGRVVASELVGQRFQSSEYFHGRPSAAGYDPFSVSGSNWAPSNPDLRSRAAETAAERARLEGVAPEAIPVDLVAASGSGIDPHISPESAELQVSRVAAARGMEAAVLSDLLAEHVEGPVLGLLGQPRVNVVKLNLALDRRLGSPRNRSTRTPTEAASAP